MASIQKQLTKLRATQTLLQRAHDYIETHGFDISVYADSGDTPRCCYIGTVRRVAGLDPEPRDQYDYVLRLSENAAYKGDGPELREAFKTLDRIAKRQLSPKNTLKVPNEWRGKLHGRWIESLGFQVQEQGLDDEEQTEKALQTFRAALTSVYKKIEKLEAQLA